MNNSTKTLGNIFMYFLKMLRIDSFYTLGKGGYLSTSGWLKSYMAGVPIDKYGNPIPWYTYSFISFIKNRINKKMMVFEYGSGNSTLWWAGRVKQVISYEHDKSWYEEMEACIPKNVELHYVGLQYGGEYSKKISKYIGMFDIVVIDGRDRVNCSKNCLNALKKGGVIIWDNSERKCYREGYDYLIGSGYKRIDFNGMGPVNAYPWSTTIFYKEDNCLGV